jgi:uncharacterized protein (DUF2237 family)
MSKTIQEQIEVMQHYANGGDIEIFSIDHWVDAINPGWNWNHCDYRIKEQKKAVVIEKWLMKDGDKKSFFIAEGDKSYLENYNSQVEKIRLLETYEVVL